METQVRTPQAVFMQPQRFVVPLFQRPYVWNEEDGGKRKGLEGHDVLLLNRELLRTAETEWTHAHIRSRCDQLAKLIFEIWPAPPGHQSGFARKEIRSPHRVDLADLISAGRIQPGAVLYPRRKQFAERIAKLLSEGRIDIDGKIYSSPSEAAKAITGSQMNGWCFFLVGLSPRRSLKDVRLDYLETIASDSDEDDADDDTDDES